METHSLITSLLIYLAAAVVAVPLSKALGLGAVVGYLLAGIAIGPWGLRWVTDVQSILHFSEFGVVLMLFLVGLELAPSRLWAMRRPIFGWGGAQVLVCVAAILLMTAILAWLLPALRQYIGWQIAIVAALGMALSSTAIALQVLGERNQLPTPAGQAAFSILLFQDVAAIPILAFLPLLAIGQTAATESGNAWFAAGGAWFAAGKAIAAIGLIMLGGRVLLRPVFRWIARSDSPEIFTAAALLLVVAIAALMQWVGLSMALGAFLAGVLLADSEYRHQLETDIAPFKGLLLGLFFIAVGMSIDFLVVLAAPFTIFALVVAFMGVKALVIFALAKAMKIPFQERPVFVLLLAQGGEFAFVVFQQAAGLKILDTLSGSVLTAAVALSMLLSPFILVLLDKFLLPRYANCGRTQMEELSTPQNNKIIIAGVGRFGQIVLRLLAAKGYTATVLDHDAEHIQGVARFGYRVFYGDATRLDLLRTAGAASAAVMVVAIDDVTQSLAVVDHCLEHFPQLQLVVRARNVQHFYELRSRGVTLIQRETFESALGSAQDTLQALGESAEEASMAVSRFRAHNLAQIEAMWPHFKDEEQLISLAKAGVTQLQTLMAQEREVTMLK